jgi:predicted nucleotidyltransferase
MLGEVEMVEVPPDAAARLRAFRISLERSLPGSDVKVVLFGSRARGDARPDSDYDLAILVRDGSHRQSATRDIVAAHAFSHIVDGYPFAPIVLPGDYLQPVDGHFRTELARRIAREGVTLS